MKPKDKKEIVKVEWEDITFFRGEYDKRELETLINQRIETVGFLVEEDENYLTIALSLELTEPYRTIDLIKIPKKNVLNRMKLQ